MITSKMKIMRSLLLISSKKSVSQCIFYHTNNYKHTYTWSNSSKYLYKYLECIALYTKKYSFEQPWIIQHLLIREYSNDDGKPKPPPSKSVPLISSAIDDIPKPKIKEPLMVKKSQRKKIDFRKSYYENIYITPMRAMDEYMLDIHDFEGLKTTNKRSAYPDAAAITVYNRRDVEKIAIQIWGSLEELAKERQKKLSHFRNQPTNVFNLRRAKKEYIKQFRQHKEEKPFIFTPLKSVPKESLFQHGSGKVVLYALLVNGTNCILKFGAWIYTGSHSMFSEFIHSFADTANQLILALGLHQSLKKADPEHPYGWASFRNVSSLISGVSIFCMGAGLSWYHGIMGLLHPATLLVAVNQVRESAKKESMTAYEYVMTGNDPSTTVVMLEDAAAVLGVMCAASCMSISYVTGNPMADAVGSLLIGTLLGGVSSFIIYTNTVALVGRSIPMNKKLHLMKELEADRMIRTLHDVKATGIGSSNIRFKAEVDFDGRELTRYYLERYDLDKLLQEMELLKTTEDAELFMLRHGESIVDLLGSEVDRIEQNLKGRHPEIRHVDLEQL